MKIKSIYFYEKKDSNKMLADAIIDEEVDKALAAEEKNNLLNSRRKSDAIDAVVEVKHSLFYFFLKLSVFSNLIYSLRIMMFTLQEIK